MALGLIGKKIGMTQVFSHEGDVVPVTVIELGPCAVVQKKSANSDGYEALQLGYRTVKFETLNKPQQGHFKRLGGAGYAVLREFRTDEPASYDVGQELTVELFEPGEQVEVSGTSKGRGFSGNIKRWGFHRGPMKHGSKFHRGVGGVAGSAYPGKVRKGKKMPGQYGNVRVSAKRLTVVDTIPEQNIIMIRGSVPGAANGIVTVSKLKG